MNGLLVITSKLQRKISYSGIDDVLKLAVDTAGALKRLDRSPREAESVQNLVTGLKNELDRIPSEEADARLEVNPSVAKVWLTVLAAYTRRVTRVEKSAGQLEMQTTANTVEDAAQKLAAQLQEQLNLPLQPLEAIVSEQDRREKEEAEDRAFAKGTAPAPHRGPRTPKTPSPDLGLGEGAGAPADSRSRRGARPARGGKWNREHRKAEKSNERSSTAAD